MRYAKSLTPSPTVAKTLLLRSALVHLGAASPATAITMIFWERLSEEIWSVNIFSVILKLNSLMRYFNKSLYLGSLLVPTLTDRSGIGRSMGLGVFFDDESQLD